MADDEAVPDLVPVALAAAATALDPTGGIASSLASHVLTNISSDSAWRAATQDLWCEIIIENDEQRRRQYEETQGEFHRHRIIIDWIKEEIEHLGGRVDDLEIVERRAHPVAPSGMRGVPLTKQDWEEVLGHDSADANLVFGDLIEMNVLQRAGAGLHINLTAHGVRLAEYVQPPPQTP